MPSGVMSNLIAVMTHVRQKGHTAIMANNCHIHKYERGGVAALGSIFSHLVTGKPDGTVDLNELENLIPIANEHLAQPDVICLENSHGGCNGAAVKLSFVQEVAEIAQKNDLKMHCDGARYLNALLATGDNVEAYSSYFDTISFCMSKGMGCPIGSVLVGSEEDMRFARNIRKMLGG